MDRDNLRAQVDDLDGARYQRCESQEEAAAAFRRALEINGNVCLL